ncbi:MAG: VCBS repeat-containing protein [Gemmatimonadales bacterium]
MSRRALVGLFALAACSSPSPTTSPPAPAVGEGFVYDPSPFPVADSTGRSLDLAFLGGFNVPRPQLLDIDKDGDLDLVVQEFGGRLTLLLRDGESQGYPRFRYVTNRFGNLDVGEWSRFVDFDGDGDSDLLAEWPFSYIRAYRNEGGTPTAPAFVAARDSLRAADGTAIFADRQNIAQAVDLDCDGLIDLFIGRITGNIIHYEATEKGVPLPKFQHLTDRFENIEIVNNEFGSMHGANTMAFADYDGDGDLDLFWGDFFEQGLLLIENTGASCSSPSLRTEPVRFPRNDPLLTSGYNAPAFGDLDGDGKPDLLVGVLGGAFNPIATTIENLHYLTRDPSGNWVRRTGQFLPAIDVGSESVPSLVDLDGDGDLDLLLANKIEPDESQTARIYRYENVGTRTAPSYVLRGDLGITGTYHYAPAWGDLDGDGDLDLILGSWVAKLAYFRNDGDARAMKLSLVDSALVTITRGSNTTPALGDLDGDGDLDLLIGEASGALNYYRNDGGPTAPRFVLVSDQYLEIDVGRRSAPAFADLDGDGDLDLLIGSDSEGVVLYRNEGTRTEPRFVRDSTWSVDVPPISAPTLGDVDGDGDLDLVVGNVSGGALYFDNRARRR